MGSTVTVDERTKARLERLRASVERATGREVSQRELLAWMVDREFEDQESLADSFREERDDASGVPSDDDGSTDRAGAIEDDFEGLSEEETERWLSGTSDWGFETTPEEVDEILYGDPDEFRGRPEK